VKETLGLWFFTLLFLVGGLGSILLIGKPREPHTPANAALIVVFDGLLVALLWWVFR